ncbi:Transmembrane protein 120B, partial [Fragariocoptes setiger]
MTLAPSKPLVDDTMSSAQTSNPPPIPATSPLTQLHQDHVELEAELDRLEELHKSYQTAVYEANRLQGTLGNAIDKKCKRLKEIKSSLSKIESHSDAETALKYHLNQQLEYRHHQLKRFQDGLPKTGELYLRVILGSFNVNLVEKDGRFKYKERYERFKLINNLIIFVVALTTLLLRYRALDAILHFILVWYHCTLTIRESILIANGSRIKGWWRAVQFITTIQAGVMIVWPDGPMYNEFRSQFLLYTIFTALLQCVQFYYQHSCLYRLRALGELYDMDITIQGFASWMWRGLSFLLPLLYAGYAGQLYNAYKLYELYQRPECQDWQVLASCLIYFVIFLGNTLTTTFVVQEKIRRGVSGKLRAFASRVKKRKDSLTSACTGMNQPYQD